MQELRLIVQAALEALDAERLGSITHAELMLILQELNIRIKGMM